MRCFVAIELPERILRSLETAGGVIRATDPHWAGEKWTAPEAMHITLKFLGELTEEAAHGLMSEMREAFAIHTSFVVTVAGIRAIPVVRRATMIWASVDDPTGGGLSLSALADGIAQRHGVAADRRGFTPHVTLCRARRPRPVQTDVLVNAERVSGLECGEEMSVPSVSFFSSTLTPRGPIHERLARFELGAHEGR